MVLKHHTLNPFDRKPQGAMATGGQVRLRLTVEDEGSVSELENKIMASAQRSRMAYFDTADAVAEFSRKAGSVFGGDTDQMIAFVEQANKQFTLAAHLRKSRRARWNS